MTDERKKGESKLKSKTKVLGRYKGNRELKEDEEEKEEEKKKTKRRRRR
jgi:hypothetical protein